MESPSSPRPPETVTGTMDDMRAHLEKLLSSVEHLALIDRTITFELAYQGASITSHTWRITNIGREQSPPGMTRSRVILTCVDDPTLPPMDLLVDAKSPS